MSIKKENDFFNLNSDDEDDDDDDNKNKEKIVSKWDWDKPENKNLYFNNDKFQSSNLKRELKQEQKNDNIKKLCKYDYNENNDKFKRLIGHTDSVNRIYFSKKSQNKNLLLSSSLDSTIIIWDIFKNSILKKLSNIHSKSIRNAIWSNYETEIASVSYDQTCVLTNTETGEIINKLNCNDILTAITTHPLHENVYLIGSQNIIYAWDTRTTQIIKKYESKMGQVQDLLFLNENEFISSGDVIFKESAEYALMVWDFETSAVLSNQIYHEKFMCTCLKKHPNWNLFYAQTHGNYIAEFSSRRPYKLNKYKRYEGHESQGYYVGFDINPEGNLLISGSIDGNAVLYNQKTSKILKKFNIFKKQTVIQPCLDAKFHPFIKNKYAFSCWSGLICIYDDIC